MDTKSFIADTTIRLGILVKIKEQEIKRNKELIESTRKHIESLKIANLEMKYCVECIHDYLKNAKPQSPLVGPDYPDIIDFNYVIARQIAKRHLNHLKESIS